MCHNLAMYAHLSNFKYTDLKFTRIQVNAETLLPIRYSLTQLGLPSFVITDDEISYVCTPFEVDSTLKSTAEQCRKSWLELYAQTHESMIDPISLRDVTSLSLNELARLELKSNLLGYGPAGPLIPIIGLVPEPHLDVQVQIDTIDPYYPLSERLLAEDEFREPVESLKYVSTKFRVVYADQTHELLCTIILPRVGKFSPQNTIAILQRSLRLWVTTWSLTYRLKTSPQSHLKFTIPDELQSQSISRVTLALEQL